MSSQCNQDKFVIQNLALKNGFWLDIGCRCPIEGNNTYILEKEHQWQGVSIDFDESQIRLWEGVRKTENLILADALKIDYEKILEKAIAPPVIDYLTIDLEPPCVTLNVLSKIPFNKYEFKVITFEHDGYREESKTCSVKENSRDFFLKLGYRKVSDQIVESYHKNLSNAEDWYINPKYLIEIK